MKFNEPNEVMTQLRTFVWLLGNINKNNALSEDCTFGLYMLGEMIADNVEAMIKQRISKENP